jgi:hypothetical protein
MAFWIVILVALVALGALALYLLKEQSIERERIDKELHDERTPTLEYIVPTGQDPVGIMAALERAGYTASVDPHHTHQHVLIACPGGIDRQRAQVRSLIASAGVTTPEDGVPVRVVVRFRDEA